MRGRIALLIAMVLATTTTLTVPAQAAPTLEWVGASPLDNVYNPAPRYLNDHTVIKGNDGLWHMFGITADKAPPGAFPDPALEVNFAHATAASLTGPWTTRPHALRIDRGYYGEDHLWAPHVIEHNGTYYMFYAAGGANAAINLATSTDLYHWTRLPSGPLFRDHNGAGRDPMVVRVGDQWVMYYCATAAANGGNHTVAYRTSTDLIHWSGPRTAFTDPTTTANSPSTTESPFVMQHNGWWYLFIGPRGGYVGTDVYRSLDPLHFELADYAGHVPGHAVEVVQDDWRWFATAAGSFQTGLYVGQLRWQGYAPPWQSSTNPAVARNADGRLEAFAVNAGGSRILRRVQLAPNGGWSGWQEFGGHASSTPSVGQHADGRLVVFSLAADGSYLETTSQLTPGGDWGPWERFGGPAGAVPAVGRNADGRLEVFALGPAGGYIAHRWQHSPNGGWSDWAMFGGPAGGPPVVASNADGRLEVFAVGPGGAYIAHRWQHSPNGGWSDWAMFGGPAATTPTVGRNADGRLEVYALKPIGLGLAHRFQLPGGGWSTWRDFGTWAGAPPTVATNADGRIEVFALGPGSDYISHRWQHSPNGSWSDWAMFGGPAQCAPAVGRQGDGRLTVFGLTPGGGQLYQRTQSAPSSGWHDWQLFGGPGLVGNLACGAAS